MDKPEISAAGKTETSVAESDAPDKTETSVAGTKSDAPDNKTETSGVSAKRDAPDNKTDTSVASAESERPDNKRETLFSGGERPDNMMETSVAGAKSDALGNKTDTSVAGAKSNTPGNKTETVSSEESDAPGNMMETSVASVKSDAPDNQTETSVAGSESDASGIKTETSVAGVQSYLSGNETEIPVIGAESDAPENKTQRSVVGTESGAKRKVLVARRKRFHSRDKEEMKPKRRVTFKDPIREPSPIRCLSPLNFGGAEGEKDAKLRNAGSLKSSLKSPTKSLKVNEKSEKAQKSLSIARHDMESDRMDEAETSGAENDAPGNKVEITFVAEIAASGAEQKALGARPKCFLSRDKEKKKRFYKRRVTFKDPIREPSPIRCFSRLNLEAATGTQDAQFEEASPLQSCLKSSSSFRKVKAKGKNVRKTRLISSFGKESDRRDEPETSDSETGAKQKSLDSLSKCFPLRYEDQSKQFSTHRFVVEEVFESPVKEAGPSNLFSALPMERRKNENFGGASSLQSSSKSPYSPRKVRKAFRNARKQDSAIDTARNRIIDMVYDEMPASKKGAMAKSMLKSFGSLTTNRLYSKEEWTRILNSLYVSFVIVAKTAEDKLSLYNDEDPYSKCYRNIRFQEINADEEVIKAVNEHGFVKPSAAEKAVLKIFFGYRKNVILQATPGSGKKTMALIMACLRTIDLNLSHPQVIIVYFRRADSAEALNVAKKMTKYLPEVTFHLVVYPFHEGSVDTQVIIGKPFDILFLINNRCFNPKNVVTLAMDDVQNANPDNFIVVCEKLLTRIRKTIFAIAFLNPAYTTKIPVMDIMTKTVKNPAYVKVSSKKCIVHFLFYCFRESEKATFIKKAYKIFNRFSSKFVVFYNYTDSLLERIDNLRSKVCVLHEYLTREEIKQRLMNFRSKPDIVCIFSSQSNLVTLVGDFVRTVVNLKEFFTRTGKIEIAGVVMDLATHLDEYSINELNEWFEYRVLNL